MQDYACTAWSPNEKPGIRAIEGAPLIKRITELAQSRPRSGCKRLYDAYEREARDGDPYINYKRFRRLYRLGNLQIPKRRRRSRAKYVRGVPLRRADRPNDIWTMDFVSDRLLHGRVFRALTLLDECSRYALAIQPEFSYPSASVVYTLERTARDHGYSSFLRVDNELSAEVKPFRQIETRDGTEPPDPAAALGNPDMQ